MKWAQTSASTGGPISGAITVSVAQHGPSTANVDTTTRAFTGTVDAGSFVLNFPQPFGSSNVLTGQRSADTITLSIPQADGQLVSLVFKPGSTDQYNAGLTALRAAMSSAAQTSSSAPADSSAPRSSRTYDSGKVQNDMLAILTGAPPDGYGIPGVTDPICPSGMPVVSGATFTCAVRINGETKHVTITVLDDVGKYQVGAPQ